MWRQKVAAPETCPFGITVGIGLGTVVAAIATPIARALNLPCIDKETRQLKADSPCEKRKQQLNQKLTL